MSHVPQYVKPAFHRRCWNADKHQGMGSRLSTSNPHSTRSQLWALPHNSALTRHGRQLSQLSPRSGVGVGVFRPGSSRKLTNPREDLSCELWAPTCQATGSLREENKEREQRTKVPSDDPTSPVLLPRAGKPGTPLFYATALLCSNNASTNPFQPCGINNG